MLITQVFLSMFTVFERASRSPGLRRDRALSSRMFLRQATLQLFLRGLLSTCNAAQFATPAARPKPTAAEARTVRSEVQRQQHDISGISRLLRRYLPTGREQLTDQHHHRWGVEIATERGQGRPVWKSYDHSSSSSPDGKHHVQVDSTWWQPHQLRMWPALDCILAKVTRQFCI